MKNVFFILCFSLITCSVFGQSCENSTSMPEAFPEYFTGPTTVVIPCSVPVGGTVTATYCRTSLANAYASSFPGCGAGPRIVWDGCSGDNNLSASGQNQCITVQFKRFHNNFCPQTSSYDAWVGLDIVPNCPNGQRHATLRITVIEECCPAPIEYCDLSACQHESCVTVSNAGTSSNCCARVTFLQTGQSTVVTVPAGQSVDACISGVSAANGYSFQPINCPPPCSNCLTSEPDILAMKGINTNSTGVSYGIYPSVASENVTIKFPPDFEGETNVIIVDLSGRIILQQKFDADIDANISINNWLGGIYLVKMSNKYGKYSQKFMIQH